MRNTLKLLTACILAVCLLAGMTVGSWADTAADAEILAEYNRLMEAEAGDAVDAFLNGLTQPQKNNLMLTLDAMQTDKGEPETSGQCGELTWVFADGTLTISGTGAMPDFELTEPAPWFALREQIQEVKLESGVTGIGSLAFLGCTELTNVVIPEGVEAIGGSAFFGCGKLDGVQLPESLKSLGAWAFSECESLTAISIPKALVTLEEGTFAGCTGLQSVVLDMGLETIGVGAFENCTALKEAAISESVKSIEYRAFAGSGLTSIRFAGTAPVIAGDAFEGVAAQAAYPCADAKWEKVTAAVELDWKAEHPASSQETVKAKEATCTEAGCTEGTRCTACGAMISGETIEPLGHDFADGICTRCGMEEPVIEEEEILLEMPPVEDEEPIASQETEAPAELAETTESENAEQSEAALETEAAESVDTEEAEAEPAGARIYAKTVYSHPGKLVDVAICMENNPGVVSVSLNIRWDEKALMLLEVEDTGLLPGGEHKPTVTNPYRLTWANDAMQTDMTEDGALVILHFKTETDAASGTYPINISYDAADFDIYDCQLNPVNFVTEDGGVEIGRILPGDVNGDGKVNNMDRALLTRYLSGWEFPDGTLDLEAADLNGDGKVNNIDRAILARILAGWDQ